MGRKGCWALPLKFLMRPLSHSDSEFYATTAATARPVALSTANAQPTYFTVTWPADEAGAREGDGY
jgi:hypothetical protein